LGAELDDGYAAGLDANGLDALLSAGGAAMLDAGLDLAWILAWILGELLDWK